MNKEVTSPSFSSVRYPKLQIFVEMFRTNVKSPVWIRHIGVPPWDTNMAAGKGVNTWNLLWLSRRLVICNEQTIIHINTFPNTLSSQMA